MAKLKTKEAAPTPNAASEAKADGAAVAAPADTATVSDPGGGADATVAKIVDDRAGVAADIATAPRKTMDMAYPPPAAMPERLLEGALMVVKAKAERGRRRAGYAFTRAETEISLSDLSNERRDALAGDAELIVTLRIVEPD